MLPSTYFFHYIPLCFFHFLLDARQQRYRISSNVLNPNLDSNFWCWSVHSLVHKRWYRRMVKHWAFSLKVWGPSLVHHCHASAFSSSWCVMIASETWGGKLSMTSSWQSWHQWSSQLQLNGSLPCILYRTLYRNTSCHHTMSKCEMSKHYMLVGSSWWNVWGIGGTNWGSPSFCLTPIVQWTEIVMPEMPFERRMLRRNLPTLWHAMVYPSSFFPWIEKNIPYKKYQGLSTWTTSGSLHTESGQGHTRPSRTSIKSKVWWMNMLSGQPHMYQTWLVCQVDPSTAVRTFKAAHPRAARFISTHREMEVSWLKGLQRMKLLQTSLIPCPLPTGCQFADGCQPGYFDCQHFAKLALHSVSVRGTLQPTMPHVSSLITLDSAQFSSLITLDQLLFWDSAQFQDYFG